MENKVHELHYQVTYPWVKCQLDISLVEHKARTFKHSDPDIQWEKGIVSKVAMKQ